MKGDLIGFQLLTLLWGSDNVLSVLSFIVSRGHLPHRQRVVGECAVKRSLRQSSRTAKFYDCFHKLFNIITSEINQNIIITLTHRTFSKVRSCLVNNITGCIYAGIKSPRCITRPQSLKRGRPTGNRVLLSIS